MLLTFSLAKLCQSQCHVVRAHGFAQSRLFADCSGGGHWPQSRPALSLRCGGCGCLVEPGRSNSRSITSTRRTLPHVADLLAALPRRCSHVDSGFTHRLFLSGVVKHLDDYLRGLLGAQIFSHTELVLRLVS